MIKMPIFHEDVKNKLKKQVFKVKEEADEIVDAYLFQESRERKISEVFDVIQAAENLLYMDFTKDEIQEGSRVHYLKMQERVKSRDYVIDKYIEIKVYGEL